MRRTVALAAAVAALLLPVSAHAVPAPAAAPGASVTLTVREALDALDVAQEDTTEYKRSYFRHWIDADRDGCNTRQELLLEEAVEEPEQGERCRLTGGRWYSAYDDKFIDGASGLDADHRVPLGEAWDSGATGWTAQERQHFANDLGDPRSLVMVSASSNRSKGEKDPAQWQPPAEANRCEYNTEWIVVKTRFRLSVDPAEKEALGSELAECPNDRFTVELAR
ncbi:HNH endonuclease family protein [Streptomyces sp. IBSBF 2394]|uniref:HNH endonuclease family protein n=1 Tax=Streptomyces sp. IBSBF 2394 TaxID=2903532 RepID=UPI002FDBF380